MTDLPNGYKLDLTGGIRIFAPNGMVAWTGKSRLDMARWIAWLSAENRRQELTIEAQEAALRELRRATRKGA